MNSINLIDFAESEQKIPKDFLQDKVSSQKVFFKFLKSNVLDCFAITFILLIFTFILGINTQAFIQLPNINLILTNFSSEISLLLFLPICCGYYFFSLYFNQGQTWGMSVCKTRIHIPEYHFKASFIWAIKCMLFSCSYGLSYLFTINAKEIRPHDHLYSDLMTHKDWIHMDLRDKTVNDSHPLYDIVLDQAA